MEELVSVAVEEVSERAAQRANLGAARAGVSRPGCTHDVNNTCATCLVMVKKNFFLNHKMPRNIVELILVDQLKIRRKTLGFGLQGCKKVYISLQL